MQLGDAELSKLAELLRSSLETHVSSMTISIVDGVLGGLQTKIAELESENNSLKTRVQTLEERLDRTEQYSRRNCLRLSGVPETTDESVDDKVMDISTCINADVSLEGIDGAHRLAKPKPNVPRDITIKFATYRSKKKVMMRKSQLKSKGKSGVYVNEDLTRARSDLFYKARSLAKAKKINSTWTADGTIIIKDNSMRFHRVDTPSRTG